MNTNTIDMYDIHIKKKIRLSKNDKVAPRAKKERSNGLIVILDSESKTVAGANTKSNDKQWMAFYEKEDETESNRTTNEELIKKIDNLNIIVSNLINKVTWLESENYNLKSEVSFLSSENYNLKSEVSFLKADNISLNTRIDALESENYNLKSEVSFLRADNITAFTEIKRLSKFRLYTTINEMLLFLIGEQPLTDAYGNILSKTSCTRFNSNFNKQVKKLFKHNINVSSYLDKKLPKNPTRHSKINAFYKIANDVIDYRNNHIIHYSSVGNLDIAMKEARETFELLKDLKVECEDLWIFVENYEDIKKAFDIV